MRVAGGGWLGWWFGESVVWWFGGTMVRWVGCSMYRWFGDSDGAKVHWHVRNLI